MLVTPFLCAKRFDYLKRCIEAIQTHKSTAAHCMLLLQFLSFSFAGPIGDPAVFSYLIKEANILDVAIEELKYYMNELFIIIVDSNANSQKVYSLRECPSLRIFPSIEIQLKIRLSFLTFILSMYRNFEANPHYNQKFISSQSVLSRLVNTIFNEFFSSTVVCDAIGKVLPNNRLALQHCFNLFFSWISTQIFPPSTNNTNNSMNQALSLYSCILPAFQALSNQQGSANANSTINTHAFTLTRWC
jgi:hypothetical protein